MTRNKKKMKNGRRGRRHVINDVPMNDTNIRVRFRKAITFDYASFQEKILLNPGISTLTKDLAVVYKLYRSTTLKFTFQASTFIPGTGSNPRYAINYVPALEFTASAPLTIEDYEGPAVGFWQSNRGHPYTWKVPGNVLNAMPYNWYETKSNSPDVSDLTQGTVLSTCDLETDAQTALMEIVFEFQTLEDPDFLASLVRDNAHNPDFEIIRKPMLKQRREEEEIYGDERSSSAQSVRHSARRRRD
jgi:hypothetical protein